MPHMHLLGKSVKITMTPRGGKPEVLIDIAHWDYNWQETYWLAKPIPVEAGTQFDIEAVFDNRGSMTASFAPFILPSMILCACGLK